MASLEGWNFTIKLCPRPPKLPRPRELAKFFPGNSRAGHESPANLPIVLTPVSNCLMKSLCLFGIASLALVATGRGDLTIVQKVEGSEGVNRITLKVKGHKACVAVNPQITTIVDATTGDITTLLKDKKTVMRISGERAKAMAEMAKSFVKTETPTQPLPKPTGNKETIDGYETEEYVSESPNYHASCWVAKGYPDYENIKKQMAVLQQGAFANLTKGMPDFQALPGLPLRTKVTVPGQSEITSTIESVNQLPLADSDFAIPADYSEVKLPDFMGGKQPPEKAENTGKE